MEKEVFTVNLEKVIREMKLDRLYYPNKEVLIVQMTLTDPACR